MPTLSDRARAFIDHLLVLYAFAWPLDVYLHMPGVPLPVTAWIGVVLVASLGYSLFTEQRFRIPFAILWPLFALGACIALATFMETLAQPATAAGGLLLFAAVVHFADSRGLVQKALLASLAGTAVAALGDMLHTQAPLLPAAELVRAASAFAVGANPFEARFILGAGLAGGLGVAVAARDQRGRQALGILVAVGAGTAIAVVAWHALNGPWNLAPFERYAFPPLSLLPLVLVFLWITARVAAKLVMAFEPRDDRWPAVFLALFLVAFMVALSGGYRFAPHHGALAGLACAYALPDTIAPPRTRRPWLAAPLVLILAALNAALVLQLSPPDPRHYDAALARYFEKGAGESFTTALQEYSQRYPDEPRLGLWQARYGLRHGAPYMVVDALRHAMTDPEEPTLLATPHPAEIEDLVVRLRDLADALPPEQAGLSYEAALVATGEVDSAMYVLERRFPELANGDAPPVHWTRLAAELLGNIEIAPRFSDWSRSRLRDLLDAAGVVFVERTREGGPKWVVARRSLDRLHVVASRGADGDPVRQRMPVQPPRLLGHEAIVWRTGDFDGPGYELHPEAKLNAPNAVPIVSVLEDGSVRWRLPVGFVPAWRPAALVQTP